MLMDAPVICGTTRHIYQLVFLWGQGKHSLSLLCSLIFALDKIKLSENQANFFADEWGFNLSVWSAWKCEHLT